MIRIDSRRVEPGDTFIAIGGGHEYIEDALARGAAHIISEGDTLLHLQELARARPKPKVVAVTGSVGKTTTKEYIAAMLRQRWRVYATPGNQNSQIGLPLSVLEAPDDAEVWVLEMAMSEPGQIRRLTEIAPPDIALITKVVYKHAENFNSLEEIREAKREIFSQPGIHIEEYPREVKGWTGPPHLAENFAAAAAVARAMGLSEEEIYAAELPGVSQRFSVTSRKGITVVDDTYNTCAASITGALQSLPQGRRIGFLSEMRELGKFSDAQHDEVGHKLLEELDILYCIGEGAKRWEQIWRAAGKPCRHLDDAEALLAAAKEEAQPGDVLLFKGSRVYALEKIVSRLLQAL